MHENPADGEATTQMGIGLRMTPADPIGLPKTIEGRRLFQEKVAVVIKASKQRLVDIGYTDAEGNVIRPELGKLPPDNEAKAQNGRRAD